MLAGSPSGRVANAMLTAYLHEFFLRNHLKSPEDFHPLPKKEERNAWDAVPQAVKDHYIRRAEEILEIVTPPLLASEYMAFYKDGSRTHYEEPFHDRRVNLRNLMIAECCENRGRFLSRIVDEAYLICDEFTWTVPAHNHHAHIYDGVRDCLPDPGHFQAVDLFGAETGALLSLLCYFFGEDFDRMSPCIQRRIRQKVTSRILRPLLDGNAMSWMGYGGHHINNWVPWLVSNCLPAAMLFGEGFDRIVLMQRLLSCLELFLDTYQPDGGCDEGPGYWNAAGACLFDCLELLREATGGAIQVYDQPLIASIGAYMYQVHLFDRHFVNFADCAPIPSVSAELLWRYGERVGDPTLQQLGLALFDPETQLEFTRFFPYRSVLHVLAFGEMMARKGDYHPQRQSFLENLQVGVSRDPESGLTAAWKGGHNDESHNHNDVGCFMVYRQKQPVVIDPGVEEYTAKTFGPERYTIWTMQSPFHNLPLIGGQAQQAGRDFAASRMDCQFKEDGFCCRMGLEHAYPKETGIRQYDRTISGGYGSDGWVRTADALELEQPGEACWYLNLADQPELEDGSCQVNGAILRWDAAAFTVSEEDIPLTSPKLIADWEGRRQLYRLAFTPKAVSAAYNWWVEIR